MLPYLQLSQQAAEPFHGGTILSDTPEEGPTMREVTNVRSEIKTSRVPEVGEGGEEQAVAVDQKPRLERPGHSRVRVWDMVATPHNAPRN